MTTKKYLLNQIEHLEKELDDVKRAHDTLFKRIIGLIDCHERSSMKQYSGFGLVESYSHATEKARTERAGIVTLDDLAKLVIDGTPITITKSVEEEITPMCHDLQKSHKS